MHQPRQNNAPEENLRGVQLVKKHACGGFFDECCTVYLRAYGSPGGKRRATAILLNPLLRKGSETTGRVSKANRGVRIARRATAAPKPEVSRRLNLGRNTRRWFRIDNRRAAARPYLWDFFDSLTGSAKLRGLFCCAAFHKTPGSLRAVGGHPIHSG